MNYPQRQKNLMHALSEKNLDALVVTHRANILYLCGFSGSAGVLMARGPGWVLYTDGRYTETTRLSPVEVTPIVSSGDAIVGQSAQPPPPVTVSLGLEYKFTMFAKDSFIRVDDEYESRPKWAWAGQDPTTLQYDPANYVLPSTNFASARAGMNLGAWQVEAFVDNLTDSHTVTNYEWSINSQVPGTSRLERDFTFRPRTIGLTFIYRSK